MATNIKILINDDEYKISNDSDEYKQKQLIIELNKLLKNKKNKQSQNDNINEIQETLKTKEEDKKKNNVSNDSDQTNLKHDKNDDKTNDKSKQEQHIEAKKRRKNIDISSTTDEIVARSNSCLNKPTNTKRHLSKNKSNSSINNTKTKTTKSLSLDSESKFEQDINNNNYNILLATRNLSITDELSNNKEKESIIYNKIDEQSPIKFFVSPSSSSSALNLIDTPKKDKNNKLAYLFDSNYLYSSLRPSNITDSFSKLKDFTLKNYNFSSNQNQQQHQEQHQQEQSQKDLKTSDLESFGSLDPESLYINYIQKSNSGYYFFGQQNLTNIFNSALSNLNPLNYNINLYDTTATQQLEYIFGSDLKTKLICDNTKFIKTKMDSIQIDVCDALNVNQSDERNSIKTSSSISSPDISISKSSTSSLTLINKQLNEEIEQKDKSNEELNIKKQQKLDEYYHIEEKQANLLVVLNTKIYLKLKEENEKQQYRLCEKDEMNNVFHVVISLEKFAIEVHQPMAIKIKNRIEQEWTEKPYFGDILIEYYHYYKIYKAILKTYPMCQITLSNLLKKKQFAAQLKKLLDGESDKLEKVNRLDMLLDRLVDLPRRNTQLLESYLKLLDQESKEYSDIRKVLTLLKDIFESSNEALNKTNNFKLCYELQYMIDPPLLDIVDQNRQLIKQGPLFKVAKRNGELLLRHLALFNDMLLVCKCDRLRKRLQLKYKIPADKITVVENSDPNNELTFRLVSSDQNNEFKAERLKDKEDWLKAFEKVKEIKKVSDLDNLENKFSNDKASSYAKLGEVPPIWIKDSEQIICSGCKEQFSFTKRRHHCRTCGRIYCFYCCNNFVPVKFNDFKNKVRVCRTCFNMLEPVYLNELEKRSPESSIKAESSDEKNDIKQTNSQTTTNEYLKSFGNLDKKEENNTEPIVIMRKSLRNDNLDDNSEESRQSSSPLTEEQLKVVKDFLETSQTTDNSKRDESDIETEDELDDSNSNRSSSNDLEIRINKAPLPPPRIKYQSHETTSNNNNNNENKIEKKYRSHNSAINFNHKKETLISDYGFLCKIPIVELNETILDDGLASSINKKNSIWEKEYLILNTDNTISVCSSSNNTNSPNLVIQLQSFQLINKNETAFMLTMDNIKEKDQDNTPIKKVKDKFKIFESNYEIKFNNKDIK